MTIREKYIVYTGLCLCLLTFWSCAKMGHPDGGWYDETPPRVMACMPEDRSTDVNAQKISIYFDEFIKLENASEKVVVSPPQMEMPEIKAAGKRIIVELKDTLKPNTTYTIDFSDAISDNNEGNPLGNFTYSFSTGGEIDTLEISGYVVEAMNMEPIKGILVGLYDNLADSAFKTQPLLRVSRTDSRGHFVIKGLAEGQYRVFALHDADGDYRFSQKSEKLAFNHDIITPTCKPDVRQDTIWRDSLHIEDILQTGYTHFLPDDIVLRAFTEQQTDRYLGNKERANPERFSLFFSYGDSILPEIEGLNFDAANAFLVEHTPQRDSLTYWLRDSALINQDTLRMALKFHSTDSLGQLVWQHDTLNILSKVPYERRMKELAKTREKWEKRQEKAKKKGQPFQTEMPVPFLEIKGNSKDMNPDDCFRFNVDYPLAYIDTTAIHLYEKADSTWEDIGYHMSPQGGYRNRNAGEVKRFYQITPNTPDGRWTEGYEYSFEIDSAGIADIYGHVNNKYKQGIKMKTEDEYTTITLQLTGTDKPCVVQLLDGQDKPLKEQTSNKGTVFFRYVKPGIYYLRAFEDDNNNGIWDTGNYDADQQPEALYYYPEKVECKAKWTVEKTWVLTNGNSEHLKPSAITKQKAEKEKKIKQRNIDRANKLGIEYIPKTVYK